MRALLERRDWPAVRDTILWFTLTIASAYLSYRFWQVGSVWAIAAPLRAHLSHHFHTLNTPRRVSFWYGARSRQEIFYQDYFEALARRFHNFRFHIALSDPLLNDAWAGFTGDFHDVLLQRYLKLHPQPADVEYYLCGPPVLVRAARAMLDGIDVPELRIYFDEF